ncbi:hypothetical protein C8Q72DRAFT_756447, partial [Fomitopsis betulina]
VSAASPSRQPCPGFHFECPPGKSPYGAYPFGLHVKSSLPWNITIESTHLVLRSIVCDGLSGLRGSSGHGSRPLSCASCASLASNLMLTGIKEHMQDGVHENTPFHFHSFDSTTEILRHKNVQLEHLRFNKLNHTRKYLARGRSLDGYKRFVMSVSHSDMHARVHKVVSVARR